MAIIFFRVITMVLVVILACLIPTLPFFIVKTWERLNLHHAYNKIWQRSVDQFINKEIEIKTSQGNFKTKMSEYQNGLVKIYWDLNDMKQDDNILIEILKNEILIHPNSEVLNLPDNEDMINNGQYDQVPIIEKVLGLSKDNPKTGFFIEAGACDGKTISNSLHFEMQYGWTGLLVEPNPDYLQDLTKLGRNAWILPHCLSTKPYVETVKFDVSDLISGIMVEGKPKPSVLNDKYILDYIYRLIAPEKAYAREIQVQCFPLYSVLMALGNPHIDYFSLDVEGAEAMILQTLPWDKINVTSLTVETVHAGDIFPGSQDDIRHFMQQKGYDLVEALHIDDVFYRKDLNRF